MKQSAAALLIPEEIRNKDNGCNTYVYFMQSGGYIKIGFSQNVNKRLESIQTGHPNKVKIKYKFKGGKHIEKFLHQTFKHKRSYGEWFHWCEEIEDFVKGQRLVEPMEIHKEIIPLM